MKEQIQWTSVEQYLLMISQEENWMQLHSVQWVLVFQQYFLLNQSNLTYGQLQSWETVLLALVQWNVRL